MNIVPLIQEKWAEIGSRLQFSSDKLNGFWQAADECQIPDESRNTFCCIQMLKQWFEHNDNASTNVLIKAIDEPYVGLQDKLATIKTTLMTEILNSSISDEETTTNPPEKLDQPYINMKTKFCLEISESKSAIDHVLINLRFSKIKSEICKEIADYPKLLEVLEKHEFLNKADVSWLKYIANCANCTKAIETIEGYERLLIADKIFWSTKHRMGRFLVGKMSKSPEHVTIKDSSNAKAVVSEFYDLKEIDCTPESSEVGSVTFYWKIIEDVTINTSKRIDAKLARKCSNASLTHVGLLIDGELDLTSIDKLVGTYVT